ncbi:MAG: DoxX family protein, partial [Nevskiales bacterium]
MPAARKIALGFVFAWFFCGGIGHFLATDFFVSIVPPYIPWPLAAVYVSGVLELLGALGILLPATRRLAGWGLILLTLAVSLANIHMWLNPTLFPEF